MNGALTGAPSRTVNINEINYIKIVMHVQICCFGHKKQLFFDDVGVVVIVVVS